MIPSSMSLKKLPNGTLIRHSKGSLARISLARPFTATQKSEQPSGIMRNTRENNILKIQKADAGVPQYCNCIMQGLLRICTDSNSYARTASRARTNLTK